MKSPQELEQLLQLMHKYKVAVLDDGGCRIELSPIAFADQVFAVQKKARDDLKDIIVEDDTDDLLDPLKAETPRQRRAIQRQLDERSDIFPDG